MILIDLSPWRVQMEELLRKFDAIILFQSQLITEFFFFQNIDKDHACRVA